MRVYGKGKCEICGKRFKLGSGLHSKDKTKAYRAINGYSIRDVDVTSYYPNAILNMKLCPIALGENFLKVYGEFKEQRVTAKQQKHKPPLPFPVELVKDKNRESVYAREIWNAAIEAAINKCGHNADMLDKLKGLKK